MRAADRPRRHARSPLEARASRRPRWCGPARRGNRSASRRRRPAATSSPRGCRRPLRCDCAPHRSRWSPALLVAGRGDLHRVRRLAAASPRRGAAAAAGGRDAGARRRAASRRGCRSRDRARPRCGRRRLQRDERGARAPDRRAGEGGLRAARRERRRCAWRAAVSTAPSVSPRSGRLAAGVAHEVGNPMARAARVPERRAARRRDERRDARPPARARRSRASACAASCGNLLAFSRPPRMESAPIDLAALAEEAVALVRRAASLCRRRILGVEARRSAAGARGIAGAVAQILLNLVLNAADAVLGCEPGASCAVQVRGAAGAVAGAAANRAEAAAAAAQPDAVECRGRRPGRRHRAGGRGAALRSVLHDQAGRGGHRAGARELAAVWPKSSRARSKSVEPPEGFRTAFVPAAARRSELRKALSQCARRCGAGARGKKRKERKKSSSDRDLRARSRSVARGLRKESWSRCATRNRRRRNGRRLHARRGDDRGRHDRHLAAIGTPALRSLLHRLAHARCRREHRRRAAPRARRRDPHRDCRTWSSSRPRPPAIRPRRIRPARRSAPIPAPAASVPDADPARRRSRRANCLIDVGEDRRAIAAQRDVAWGIDGFGRHRGARATRARRSLVGLELPVAGRRRHDLGVFAARRHSARLRQRLQHRRRRERRGRDLSDQRAARLRRGAVAARQRARALVGTGGWPMDQLIRPRACAVASGAAARASR